MSSVPDDHQPYHDGAPPPASVPAPTQAAAALALVKRFSPDGWRRRSPALNGSRRPASAAQSPPGHLARIRREYPEWSAQNVTAGFGWTAHRRTERLWAGTLPDLERKLRDAGRGDDQDGQPG